MKKNKKIILFYSILFFTVILLFTTIAYPINASDSTHIILDSDNRTTIPENFRKTTDISKASALTSINLTGLDKLNISGSGQFTEFNLPLLVDAINKDFSIIDIDLREESHGFVNGLAISFANSNNSANKGLILEEVIKKENEDLYSIKLDSPLTLYSSDLNISPKTVSNELQLIQANNLNYIRIPVTDGSLPTVDMVNYFVDFVKNQPENTWLHFHCKAGVGRTTTFMIMYDILKNYNDVNLHDIIARQLLLSDINKKASVDFFVGKRYKFLEEFYNHFKSNDFSSNCNKNSLNTSFCSCKASTAFHIEDTYIKNALVPKYLYVISENDMTTAEKTMISTLQGLIASKSTEQIYILSPTEPDYMIWLKDLSENYNIKYETVKDPWLLITKFKKYINGYILFSTVKKPSINNACTLASLKSAIVIDESIEETLKNYKITNLIYDCRIQIHIGLLIHYGILD